MDRPFGPPLGAATQSTGRLIADNGTARVAPLNTVRKMPNLSSSSIKFTSSSSSLSTHIPISAGQVVALAREAMKTALEENQTKAAETSGVSNDLKPGVTIDLSHKHIQRFPEEVIDIIKNEIERLALSHNQISTFPFRFSECASLRYLNIRNNSIRDFPPSICELLALEILDLGRNKLRVLPPGLVKLTSLKVLSVQKNRIEELPLCLGDMASLQMIKLDGNPIQFPPKEILQLPTPPPADGVQEGEADDVSITSQIKKYMKQRAMVDRSETESGGEESSEGTETPRPMKRVMSGRFPIKVNGTEVPDIRSPALQRPPPIPSRSHYRGLSQQNAALRRPGVLPLTIGMTNERLRSNSENLLQVSRDRAPSDRSRRMGIVSRKASELGTVDETKTNRYSHYRGLSHGSAMQGGSKSTNGTSNTRSPASPADSLSQRGVYVRRLSSLPERKRVSMSPDPVIEGAAGILFALWQVHPVIQTLLDLVRDGTNKRTSLERVFYNASTHVEELDRDIQSYMTYSEEDEEVAPRSNESVHSACLTCVGAYIHVCALLSRNVDSLIINGEPRYIRHLLLLLYGGLAEIRNAGASLFTNNQESRNLEAVNGSTKVQSRDKSITPTRDRPDTIIRNRSATVVQHPSNLRVATDARALPFINGIGRASTMTSATPRSGESFTSSSTSGGRSNIDFTEEERIFETIFLRLQQCSENALMALPNVITHFVNAMRNSNLSSNPEQPTQFWQILIQKAQVSLQYSDSLKVRLSLIKLKEPGIRTQGAFWELCNAFIHSYTELVIKVKEAKSITTLLPMEVIALLRPLQKMIKEGSQLIQASPWAYLTTPSSSKGTSNGSAYSTQSPASQVPLPVTPQSAALGPAVQATVPSTPQSAVSYNSMFNGNVFDRADAFLSMNGGSAISSRNGTMTSAVFSNDPSATPAATMSPLNSSNSRFNGNGKMAF